MLERVVRRTALVSRHSRYLATRPQSGRLRAPPWTWMAAGTAAVIASLGAINRKDLQHQLRQVHFETPQPRNPEEIEDAPQPEEAPFPVTVDQEEQREPSLPAPKQEPWSLTGWTRSLPSIPTSIPNMPSLPSMPEVPSIPNISIPNMPDMPSAPSFENIVGSWTWPESLIRFQDMTRTLLLEMSGGKGSLYDKIVSSTPDLTVHPECDWDAEVRLGDDICLSEKAFLRVRKRKMRAAYAKLFGVPVSEIDERDIPIVALAGSGGGLRAMCNTTGALVAFQESGLLDCVTYSAGISGSCWALGVLHSGVTGDPTPRRAAEHIVDRIQVPYVDISALDLLTTHPTNKYLLSGLFLKASSPKNAVYLTDIYGTLLSSRLFVPSSPLSDLELDPTHLSLHHFRRFVDNGQLPMPIFTAISRHLPQPLKELEEDVDKEKKVAGMLNPGLGEKLDKAQQRIEGEARWLWFEFTPYETGCDELGAWIPTWSLGREFSQGKSLNRTPEISFTILSGIFASAFCASLQHYFKEVQPILRQLPAALYGWIAEIITENEENIEALHAIAPNPLPNYVKGMDGQLRTGSPIGITEPETLGFMDAGAELNVPYYPLLRRDVDCIIALDASAGGQDLWFTRAEEFAIKRGLATWPRGARWPVQLDADSPTAPTPTQTPGTVPGVTTDDAPSPTSTANRKLAAAQEDELGEQQKKQRSSEERGLADSAPRADSSTDDTPDIPSSSSDSSSATTSAGSDHPQVSTPSAHLWIGSSSSSDTAFSSTSADLMNLSTSALAARDGIGIIYLPLIPNERAAPGFDPLSVSTWRFELAKDESERLMNVAKENTKGGEEMIVMVLKAMWERKRKLREENERKEEEKQRGIFGDDRFHDVVGV